MHLLIRLKNSNWFRTLERLSKITFSYKMFNFSLRELKFSGNMYFSYAERLASAKIEKVHWLQENDKKVTMLLIYHVWLLRKVFSRIII